MAGETSPDPQALLAEVLAEGRAIEREKADVLRREQVFRTKKAALIALISNVGDGGTVEEPAAVATDRSADADAPSVENAEQPARRSRRDRVIGALLTQGMPMKVRDIANFIGEPNYTYVYNTLDGIFRKTAGPPLVKRVGVGCWELTDAGKEEAQRLSEAD
jgi:hypothetical protein